MNRLIRIGILAATACAAGVYLYEYMRTRQEERIYSVSGRKRGKLIKFPAERPPYAEAAESATE